MGDHLSIDSNPGGKNENSIKKPDPNKTIIIKIKNI
tara:strand:+ start:3701 stop:3808 length:108 start_codon:yes stop_codon:yes gene_type:complete